MQKVAPTLRMVGSGCMMLFGLPFLVGGLAGLGVCIYQLWAVQETNGWSETSALVTKVPSQTEPLVEQVEADTTPLRYEYRWEGRLYHGSTIARKNADIDNAEWMERLRVAKANEQFVPCWINPNNPAESILVRPAPSALIFFIGLFALTHGGVGFFIVLQALRTLVRQPAINRLQAQAPGQPWRWRPDWFHGVIQPEPRLGDAIWAYMAVVFNVIALWNAWLVLTRPDIDFLTKIIAIIAAGIGLLLIAKVWSCWKARTKAYRFTLENPSAGFIAGTTVKVSLTGPGSGGMMPSPGPEVTIACKETISQGKSSRTIEHWKTPIPIKPGPGYVITGQQQWKIPITLPQGHPILNSMDAGGGRLRWELHLHEPGSKSSFARFLLPVFSENQGAMAEADHSFTEDHEGTVNSTYQTPIEGATWQNLLDEESIKRTRLSDGHRYEFAPRRHRGPFITILLMAIVFDAVALGLWFAAIPAFFALLWTFFAAILLFFALGMAFKSLTVEAAKDGLVITTRYPWLTKSVKLQPNELAECRSSSIGQFNNVPYYTIKAHDIFGRKHACSLLIRSPQAADALARAVYNDVKGI